MRGRRTEANRRFVKLISLFFFLSLFLSLLGSPPVGEKQSQESYGKTQATRNEGQNPCASKDAAAVAGAAVAETREGQEVQGGKRRREGEREETETPEEKRRSTEKRERKKKSTRREGRAKGKSNARKRGRERKGKRSPSGRRDAEEAAEEGKRERRVRLLRVSCACSTLPPRPLPPPPLDRLT